MSKRVWKFELRPYLTYVAMPIGATVLSAGAQGERLFVWALCDSLAATETRGFVVAGTGEPIPFELGEFVGTAVMGPLVWHVWAAS